MKRPLLIGLLCLFGTARVAHADGGVLIVVGSGTAKDKEVVRKTALAGVQKSWVMLPDLKTDATEQVLGCIKAAGDGSMWPCVAPTAAKIGFDRVLVATVDAARAGAVAVSIAVMSAENGVALVEKATCDNCSAGVLEAATREATKKQLEALSAQKGATEVEVRTNPVGAVVALDGAIVGESNARFRTFAGKHTVMLSMSGYRTEVKQIEVLEGRVEIVEATLTKGADKTPLGPDGKPVIDPKLVAASSLKPEKGPDKLNGSSNSNSGNVGPGIGEGKPSKLLPTMLIAGGAGLVMLGTVSAVVDARRTDEDLIKSRDSRVLFGSVPMGIGVGVLGAVAAGVGIYLWKKRSSHGPIVNVSGEGAVVGWTGKL